MKICTTLKSVLSHANAWLFYRNAPKYDRVFRQEKLALFSGIKGNVLEIGPGTGINIQYFPNTIHYIGLEPSREMSKYLKRELAKRMFVRSRIICAGAESIPLEEASIDAVVSTLTLCTVKNPANALHEIRRVLRPGGVFLFIEHVAAPSGTFLRKMQHYMKGSWKIIGNGCDPERETDILIRQVDFEKVQIRKVNLPIMRMVSPHIIGRTIK